MAFDWTSLIGPAIGAFAGGGDETQTTTSTSDPWKAAQPYMLRNLQDTEQLGNALKKNPFNPQQIEQYSNLFGDIGNFRSNVAPGLMDFANRGMNSNYQRERVSRPGDVAGYGGSFQPGATNLQRQQSSGLLGPFSVAQGGGSSGGLLDLNGAQNPFSNGSVKVNPETVNEQMISDLKAELGLGNSPGNDAGDGNGPSGNGGSLMNTNAPALPEFASFISPAFVTAYNALMRSGYDPSSASKEALAMTNPGWGAAVNAYSDARAQRQEGAGESGGGQLGVGGDLGGGTYGGGGIDYGDW